QGQDQGHPQENPSGDATPFHDVAASDPPAMRAQVGNERHVPSSPRSGSGGRAKGRSRAKVPWQGPAVVRSPVLAPKSVAKPAHFGWRPGAATRIVNGLGLKPNHSAVPAHASTGCLRAWAQGAFGKN